jgi:uracil-DNA glycosylase family 4
MMSSPVTSIRDMNNELVALVGASGLSFDCGCGGSITSEVVIVAEAPGDRELGLKTPLIGGSGKYLWDRLRQQRLTRNDVYITNVVKRKLVSAADGINLTDKQGKISLSRQERTHWRHILWEELSRLPNMRYIVALGSFALQALVGYESITKARGSVFPIDIQGRRVQVLATYNPAHVMREPRMEIVFRFDLDKLNRLRKGDFHVPHISALINPTVTEALDALRWLHTVEGPIAYDIETMADETACIGFAATNTEGICINFRSSGANNYTVSEERIIRLAVQDLLMDKTRHFITQNGHFDASWLWFKDRIRCHGHYHDTMLSHHFLYPPLPHDLGFLTAQYTDHPYYKDELAAWKETGNIDEFWEYNVKDCCITRMVSERLDQELHEAGLADMFYGHVMRLQPELVNMTMNGVLSDQQLKGKLDDELGRSLEVARELCQAKARVATGQPDYQFNPRSNVQLASLFFDELQLVGRGRSVDKENRDRIRRHSRTNAACKELVGAVDTYLSEAKFVSTYIGAEPDPDDRWRCTYKQTGVASAPGRLSSSQTHWGTGLNMQNIPENAKDMFVAPPGWEFSYYDMSQIEARIVAFLANIPVWKAQFERARLHPGSYDAHCALASDMFKVPYDQVPRKDYDPATGHTIRYVAKRCRHGLNYRMAPDKLATVTGLSLVEAEQAYRLYHMASPEVTVWWDDVIDLVRRTNQVTTCLGRRWILLERFDPTALDSIVAFEPQSINGDWTSSVIYKSHSDKEWPPSARIVINVHDANIALNRISDGPCVRAIMKKHAEQPIWINSIQNRLKGIDAPEPLIVPAELGVSQPDEHGVHRWSTIKKV